MLFYGIDTQNLYCSFNIQKLARGFSDFFIVIKYSSFIFNFDEKLRVLYTRNQYFKVEWKRIESENNQWVKLLRT